MFEVGIGPLGVDGDEWTPKGCDGGYTGLDNCAPVAGGGAEPGREGWLTIDDNGGVELADLELIIFNCWLGWTDNWPGKPFEGPFGNQP